jgi:hypothetical protein
MDLSKVIIYTQEETGCVAVVNLSAEATSYEEEAAKVVPEGVEYAIIDRSELPASRTFRNAWKKNVEAVEINLDDAKVIAHENRRTARTLEMKPHDLNVTIPGMSDSAEAERVILREKYEDIQVQIDEASDTETLESILKNFTVLK